ncbi:rhomboid family intramembrane serine protease [Aurantimonas sp. MSK8Z-1]|uniref:rhomboid family intramembrane serine protease n=1 Tax=Mangrovibrevibacter kandeliae TaxID=2968473 RepID=UPI002117B7BE|nr:rhomboid family intramembrane serine protease [Aurantimonas sp. MSK8Z-1]MCW4114490.1 rhomboid family intramembrane serine protease [Aurantimonas sp. MSK8Z-1]
MHDPMRQRPAMPTRATPPPAFNAPAVVLFMLAAFALVQAVRSWWLGPADDILLVADFGFVSGCYTESSDLCAIRAAGAALWSPFTYALLHGDWMHLGTNAIWMLAFGTPVARRLGTPRFLAFSVFGSLAGALLFFALNPALMEPVIGASGIVSALMGGACRFAFSRQMRHGRLGAHPPLLSIREALSDRTVLVFVVLFFLTNAVVGAGLGGFLGAPGAVAWEAHLGGFAFGFLLFRLFDPEPPVMRAAPDL